MLGTNASNLAWLSAMELEASGSVFVAQRGGVIAQYSGGVSNWIATVSSTNVQLQGINLFDDGTRVVSDAGGERVEKKPQRIRLGCDWGR